MSILAVAIWASVWLGLPAAHAAMAQEPSRSPSPERLWKAYPLAPTAQPEQTSSPAATAGTDPRPVRTASAGTDGGTSAIVLVLVLVAAGGVLTFSRIHRRRGGELTVPASSKPDGAARPVPANRLPSPSRRFFRPGAGTTARSTATVMAMQRRDTGGPSASDDPHHREVPAAATVAKPSPMPAIVVPEPAGSPPDPRLTWTAEIEWRRVDGASRFSVIARGAGTVEVARSPPLDWPPDGPAAVQAVTDAADKLAATLVAAGWAPQPPGDAWYAKRFIWAPAIAEPAKGSKAAPRRLASTTPAEALRPTSGERGAGDPVPSRRSRAKQVVVLAVLAAVGLIAALQFGGGSDSSAGRSNPQDGIDLSFPILGLGAVLVVVLLIREIRRTPH